MAQDFKPLASGGTANVVTQAEYETLLTPPLGALKDGYEAGLAESAQVNKTLRQASVMASVIGDYIVQQIGGDVLDDGDLTTLLAQLTEAIQSVSWSTGDLKLTMKAVADSGWIMCNDGTIGSAASGASYANDDAESLFLLLWDNVIDAWAPVVGGRGGSAAADWAANKRITLTKMLGRALGIAGNGSGLTARVLGQNLGAETVALTTANLAAHTHTGPSHTHSTPNHTHTVNDPGHRHQYNDDSDVGIDVPGGVHQWGRTTETNNRNTTNDTTGITISSSGAGTTGAGGTGATGSAGSGTAHDNMQPTSFVNVMIKL